jgi:hypothetical protein
MGRFSPRLRDKNAHFAEQINLNRFNQSILFLTILVSAALQVFWAHCLNHARAQPERRDTADWLRRPFEARVRVFDHETRL